MSLADSILDTASINKVAQALLHLAGRPEQCAERDGLTRGQQEMFTRDGATDRRFVQVEFGR
ncbi:MAG: hypothetical protein ACRDV2_15970, partial [Actinomycetes bacterium]